MLCMVRFRETEFTRTLESFSNSTPTLIAEFDSSLTGAGVIWYARDNGTEVAVGVSAVDLTFLEFGEDSSFQNLAEFIGAILAVMGQIILGLSSRSLALRGDSVTALTWAITERPRGSIVTQAAMLWSLLCVATDVNVSEVTHIAGEDNEKCDRLSRRGNAPKASVEQEARDMGLTAVNVISFETDGTVMEVLRLCDPR